MEITFLRLLCHRPDGRSKVARVVQIFDIGYLLEAVPSVPWAGNVNGQVWISQHSKLKGSKNVSTGGTQWIRQNLGRETDRWHFWSGQFFRLSFSTFCFLLTIPASAVSCVSKQIGRFVLTLQCCGLNCHSLDNSWPVSKCNCNTNLTYEVQSANGSQTHTGFDFI